MKELRKKTFKNGVVYCLQLEDGFLVETTDTFLPYYTKDAIGRHQNKLDNNELGDRTERWMIGVSTMSGCPVRCKFCATGNMKRYRNLTAEEIVEQVEFAINKAGADPSKAKEFKINYTRMGEPFLNIDAVKDAIRIITEKYQILIITYQRLALREAISLSLREILRYRLAYIHLMMTSVIG